MSVIDSLDGAVAIFAKAEGLKELHRPGLSLERVSEWTQRDVCRAVEVRMPTLSLVLKRSFFWPFSK